MISKNNFDLVRLSLGNQAQDRGIKDLISIDKWDTFAGWKKRGRSIKAGSKGFKVEIVVPHSPVKRRGLQMNKFARVQKTLFSISQTYLKY
tara:strand:- start:261 stop:533 length:273 start_codon:yes stop_codon:yes gene_type:complete